MELINQNKATLKEDRDQYMYVVEFIDHNLKTYLQIKEFIDGNKNNFTALDDAEQVTAETLLDYIKNDKEPWDRLPQMKKAFNEIHTALQNKIKYLRSETIKCTN